MNTNNNTNNEIKMMWHDIIKFLIIIIIVHVLAYVIDDYGELFGVIPLKIMLYTVIGVVIYYMIIKRKVDERLDIYGGNKKIRKRNDGTESQYSE